MTSTMLDRDSAMHDDEPSRGFFRRPLPVAAVAVTVAGLVVAAVAAGVIAQSPSEQMAAPAEDSVEVGFARDMSVHHAQAVEMAELIRERTDDPSIEQLAVDISLTQQAQIGQMRGWLDVWGRSPSSAGPPMAWMHEPVEGPMPGMATPAELNRLRELQGSAADELFLTLMLKHHQAGVAMAEAALDRTDEPVVRRLARAVASAQANEQTAMRQMLSEAQSPSARPESENTSDHPAEDHS